VKSSDATPAPTLDPATLQRLRDLLARPTAPYREAAVHAWAVDRLTAANVPCCEDPDGNLIVGAATLGRVVTTVRRWCWSRTWTTPAFTARAGSTHSGSPCAGTVVGRCATCEGHASGSASTGCASGPA
jgi:hypothetical protein